MWRLGIVRLRLSSAGAAATATKTHPFFLLFFSTASTMPENLQELAPAAAAAPPPPPIHPEQSIRETKAHVNPDDYKIIKEGEADILIHGNDVFYNKAQVVNRDLSIAVLRAFVAKRKEEFLSKEKKRSGEKDGSSEGTHSEKLNSTPAEGNKKTLPVSNLGDNDSHLVHESELTSASTTSACNMPPLRVLEALAASGLRAIRYAREVEGVDSVVALDNDKVAVEACKCNIRLNGKAAMAKVQAELGDARIYMMNHEKQFDVVDVDPYGSPSIFLDSAVQCVKDGGILMCTATDMAVLCGNFGEVCYTKYGSYSVKGKHCHEMAVRILLSSIESHANRYKRHIVPILSVSIDFYVRVFVRIYTSALAVKSTPTKLSHVYQCVGCDSFFLQPLGRSFVKHNNVHHLPGIGPIVSPNCQECGKRFEMGGPIWSNPIHDKDWISSIYRDMTQLKSRYPAFDKVHGLLTAVSEELVDVPLFVSPHGLSATLKCVCPSTSLFALALVKAGYRTSCCHASPLALKTDAPMNIIWDFMRCWVKLHPVKQQQEGAPGNAILSKEPVLEANFLKIGQVRSKAMKRGAARFLPNPEGNWGPKSRAGRRPKTNEIGAKGTDNQRSSQQTSESKLQKGVD